MLLAFHGPPDAAFLAKLDQPFVGEVAVGLDRGPIFRRRDVPMRCSFCDRQHYGA
jgi:hypothetical protein